MSDTTDMPSVPRRGTEDRFPCEQCGSDLRFTPGATELTCQHCGHVQKIDAGERPDVSYAMEEIDYAATLRQGAASAEYVSAKVVVCPSCGAQTDLHEAVQAAKCPFCDTPVVTDTGEHRFIKPRALIPFVLNEGQARDKMTEWLGRLWFAPNGLKEYARKGRQMNGIYVPYWTYDADTQSRYTGRRGDAYYVTVKTKDGSRQERRIRWSPASGRVARDFDDVLVLGAKSLPKSYTDALEPWDLGALVPFQTQYLAGFGAEGYQVQLDEGFDEAKQKMRVVIEGDVRRDIGGDEQQISSLDTSYADITFKHVLLPVWVAAYKYGGQTYRFVVNGQTGKVQGERPYSKVKIAIAAVVAIVVLGTIAYFVGRPPQ
jgi:DNA-directed RNA polymerase subunit RPC12/RpoP